MQISVVCYWLDLSGPGGLKADLRISRAAGCPTSEKANVDPKIVPVKSRLYCKGAKIRSVLGDRRKVKPGIWGARTSLK